MAQKNADLLGAVTIIPPLVAVILAFITKEVVTSLFAGTLSGIYLLSSLVEPRDLISNLVYTVTSFCRAVIAVMSDPWKCGVVMLCLCVGGLIAVINRTGGFVTLAKKLTARAHSARSASITTFCMDICIFFDDYANTLIVGPVMRQVTDRMGVSRERLAFIVDSTAAPVCGIAVISSWIAAELSAIESGFAIAGVTASAYGTFLQSIPYSFYNIYCIAFVFISSYLVRDFGPMLKAEVRARGGETVKKGTKEPESSILTLEDEHPSKKESSPLYAIVPIALMIFLSFLGFYLNGHKAAVESGELAQGAKFSFGTLMTSFGAADTSFVLFTAVVVASIVAILMGSASGRFNIVKGVEIWIEGAQQLMVTAIILALSWSLAFAVERLGTCYFIVKAVTLGLPGWLVPSLIFLTCCLVSFAAGSYGTMLIVMPMAVPIACSLIAAGGMPQQFLYMCVASVLSGSIFGDHCSPITDTTILSSIGAGCENMDHVKTQLPYALTVAGIATLLGTLPAGLGCPVYISLPLGILCCVGVILIFGKNPDKIYNGGKINV